MSEHKHGSMNIEDQEKAFAGFMRLAKNVAIFAICVLIFLAIFNT
ncbi:aa3-type cytochrome c oxidase subunit IV [uncultured Boseongicola sp.]|nr:aa3-type cytochrome c oxidase subunit IV [uncultured Boseongicola sp.]